MKREDFERLLAGLSPNVRRALVAAAVVIPVGLYAGLRTSCAGAMPPETVPPVPVVEAAQLADAGVQAQAVIEPIKTTATIVFTTSPAVQATVSWGKKRLGVVKPGYPLVVTRPRDTGPLDVVVTAQGYLPVQTRAYTFNDSKMLVKLTKPEASNTLLGYRVPIEAGIPLTADTDAGSPLAAPTAPMPTF
ncbi:MAG TPA: hypothetical protein VFX59_01690 [Polyangiales bacterium]|nr:hypothetical protein [Polyangiales bacterium]